MTLVFPDVTNDKMYYNTIKVEFTLILEPIDDLTLSVSDFNNSSCIFP